MCVCMCEIGISRFWNMVVGFGGYGKGKKKKWLDGKAGRKGRRGEGECAWRERGVGKRLGEGRARGKLVRGGIYT